MIFQASDYKGRQFLKLLDKDNHTIVPIYSKGGLYLKHFEYSNTIYTRATRVITNHTPIGEYCFRFFPNKPFACLCGEYSIETRNHILH